MMKTRTEADSIGVMEVPEEAYYGVQALRAKEPQPSPTVMPDFSH